MRRVLPLVLLAAACATASPARRDPDVEACRTGVPAACARRGMRALTGEGVPRDERDAAAWLMAACERGLAQSCADLGALYAAGRGVRRDDARACELGLADACDRAGRPAPPVARGPAIVIPLEPALEAAAAPPGEDVQYALEFASFFVPMHERGRLGLTPEALQKEPPASRLDVERVGPLLDARAPWISRCLPVYQIGEDVQEGSAIVSLVLGPDGRASGVRVALDLPANASSAPADCIVEAVARWEFPRPATAGRVWLLLVGNGPVERVQPPEPPDEPPRAAGRFRPPREKVPGCLAREIQLLTASRFQGLTTAEPILAKFVVRTDGRTSRFRLENRPARPEIGAFLRRAIYSCEFEPGTDPEGRPIALWVVQPVRFKAN